ncbi:hypothetical protein KI387_027994, partial [Taxus chinensis]
DMGKGLKNSMPGSLGGVGCCDMSLKCRCRWRWDSPARTCVLSLTFIFFIASLLIFGALGMFFAWLSVSPFEKPAMNTLGCREDDEGSWSIGVYRGSNPFALHPIEDEGIQNDGSAAWPVANPVFTCASASDSSHPSNFVADPFLYIQGDALYLFFETKNAITMQGDIGVAKSVDQGATWHHLGIALDEEWHLSYPYVFEYDGQIYMTPEGSEKGDFRLYRALDFPLQWRLEKVLLKKPIVDAFVIHHNEHVWLFGSDFSRFGAKKNGELEIWYADSLFGTWKQHKGNPVHNLDKSLGARNGGRPFVFDGQLYRIGQDCGGTYGHRIRAFRVEVLTKEKYKEIEVPLGIIESKKGRNAWNGLRYHHLDAQQLSSGVWIAVMDGDRVPSGDRTRRFLLGSLAMFCLGVLIILVGVILGVVRCVFPLSRCLGAGKRNDTFSLWTRPHFTSRLHRVFSRLNRTCDALRGKIRLNTCGGSLLLCFLFVLAVVSVCVGVQCFFGGNGAEEAYSVQGQYSQFTMLTMTYEARLWNLKMYIKHYSRCASVREIVVVWNKGQPPNPETDFDSTVPVRIRVEEKNSLNNRFKSDPLIKTRAVFELDDDIMMTCDDVERGFRVWRENRDRLVGFYPRLIDGSPLKYRDEKYARTRKGYNMILTGAAFMDSESAFQKYWSDEAKEGRNLVDKFFNCEDILMNFLLANQSFTRTVEYVHPAWAVDTSKLSSAAISRDTQLHYRIRTNCLLKFSEIFGNLPLQKWEFDSRKDGWDL